MATIQDKSEDQELEQYGVWVKTGPDDVDTLDPEDSIEPPSYDSEESSNLSDEGFSLEELSLEEDDRGDSPDDFSIEEVRLDEESEDFDADVFGGLDRDSADNALTPEEEELLAPLEANDSAPPEIDIADIDFDTDLSDFDGEPGEGIDSTSEEISSLDTLPDGVSDNLSLDDITIDDEEELPELESEEFGEQEADLDTIGDLEDFSVSAEYESNLPHAQAEEQAVAEETDQIFDDVGAVTDEMSSIGTDHRQDDAMTENTTTHLRTIESELSLIKRELFALRKELSGLRGGKAAAKAHAPDDDLVTDDSDDADGGFFDDDEDETIALTGDELDNILNTAEFTEETPEPRAEQAAEPETSEIDDFDLKTLDEELESLDEPREEQDDIEAIFGQDDSVIIGDDITSHGEESISESPEVQDEHEQSDTFDTEIELSDEDLLPTELYETSDARDTDAANENSISGGGENSIDIEDELDIEALDFDGALDSFDDALDIAPLDTASPSPVYEEAAADEGEEPIEEIVLEDLNDATEPGADDLTDEWEIDDGESAGAFDATPSEGSEYGPSNDEVTALAEMDIDSELAGIDELTDDTDTDDIQPDMSAIGEIELDVESTFDNEPDQPLASNRVPPSERRRSVESQLSSLPEDLKNEIRAVLTYMDQLLEALPEEKIEEFARSEHFEVYKRLFEELGLEG